MKLSVIKNLEKLFTITNVLELFRSLTRVSVEKQVTDDLATKNLIKDFTWLIAKRVSFKLKILLFLLDFSIFVNLLSYFFATPCCPNHLWFNFQNWNSNVQNYIILKHYIILYYTVCIIRNEQNCF